MLLVFISELLIDRISLLRMKVKVKYNAHGEKIKDYLNKMGEVHRTPS